MRRDVGSKIYKKKRIRNGNKKLYSMNLGDICNPNSQ